MVWSSLHATPILLLLLLGPARHQPTAAAQEMDTEGTTPSCNLKCVNGGVCHHGEGDGQFDFLMRFTAGSKPLPFLDRNHAEANDRQHCVCPNGYTGLRCEVELQLCGSENDHVCFNGAPCKSGRSGLGDEIFYCECSQAGHASPKSFSGRMCEHASTMFCSWGDVKERAHSFCVNGGQCLETVSPDEKHPGCQCSDEWEGPHCEFKEGMSPNKKQMQQNSEDSTPPPPPPDASWQAKAAIFTVMVVLASAIVGALVLLVVKRNRQGRSKEDKSQTPVITAEAGALEADGGTMPPKDVGFNNEKGSVCLDVDTEAVDCRDGELA